MNKRGATFGEIVAIIGSILIYIGMAWLIAQNWRDIPSFLKIFILLFITIASYIVGIVLREKDYSRIARALFILGALHFTSSVFLIAQIFSTSPSLQNYAWLLLICWMGVTFSAYWFGSYTSLIIALIEFMVWLNIQFMSFQQGIFNFPSFVTFAFLFLFAGVLFYSLNLIHNSFNHRFAKLFKFWTLFYFLAFFYTISFQFILPILWSGEVSFSPAIIFLIAFGIISFILLIIGVFISLNKQTTSGKELLAACLTILLLFSLLFLTNLASDVTGACSQKTCYDYKTKAECSSSLSKLNCEWLNQSYLSVKIVGASQNTGSCIVRNCYNYQDKSSCELSSLKCNWKNQSPNQGYCEQMSCFSFTDKASCESTDLGEKIACSWNSEMHFTGGCEQVSCYTAKTQQECQTLPAKINCAWKNNYCSEDYSPYSDSCTQYNNKKDSCQSNSDCSWHIDYSSYFRHTQDLPAVILIVWIVINIFYVLFILLVIGYGSLEKSRAIVNLGIIAFAIFIFTRYLGFIIDMWGVTTLAVTFITGGVLLLFGGFIIEKWRRKLVKEIIENTPYSQSAQQKQSFRQ